MRLLRILIIALLVYALPCPAENPPPEEQMIFSVHVPELLAKRTDLAVEHEIMMIPASDLNFTRTYIGAAWHRKDTHQVYTLSTGVVSNWFEEGQAYPLISLKIDASEDRVRFSAQADRYWHKKFLTRHDAYMWRAALIREYGQVSIGAYTEGIDDQARAGPGLGVSVENFSFSILFWCGMYNHQEGCGFRMSPTFTF